MLAQPHSYSLFVCTIPDRLHPGQEQALALVSDADNAKPDPHTQIFRVTPLALQLLAA